MEEAIEIIDKRGCPNHISFDHDLGMEERTGYDFADWLVDKDLDNPGFLPSDFTYNVHSANPVGAANIRGLLSRYL